MNKYEILKGIGEGEYGQVLKARNKDNDEIVAIKKFKEDDDDEDAKRIILREVKILKTMRHENLTEFKDAFRKKGRVYLVCQFVERNLLEIINDTKGIDRDRIREYIFQIFKGLCYMHSSGLIHRDIKPENILINQDHTLKLCDFGFARVLPPPQGEMTDYVATRWYRPPELLLGISNYDESVDMWAVGCLFGEMVDGQPMFPGETQIDMLYLIQKLIGPMSADHEQVFSKNPKFVGMRFPEISNNDSLERRYLSKIGKEGMDLMKKLLKMDPRERISAAEALRHPYFTRLKSRATESPLITEYPLEKPKTQVQMTSANPTHVREKPHISMLGINKIKGVVKEPEEKETHTKSKIVINVQNIQAKQSTNTSIPKNDGKSLIQLKKQQLQCKKKHRADFHGQNYIQQFDQEEFQEVNLSKPKEIASKEGVRPNKKRLQYNDEQPEYEKMVSKTPILNKIKAKKKMSKYDQDYEEYEGPNLVFQKRKETKELKEPKEEPNVFNIVFSNNTFNYHDKP